MSPEVEAPQPHWAEPAPVLCHLKVMQSTVHTQHFRVKFRERGTVLKTRPVLFCQISAKAPHLQRKVQYLLSTSWRYKAKHSLSFGKDGYAVGGFSVLWDPVTLRKPIHHPLPCICCEEQHFVLACWIASKNYFLFLLENVASCVFPSWDSIWKVLSPRGVKNRQTT